MFRWMVEKALKKSEEMTGESADWMREIFAHSSAAAFKFAFFLPMARHRAAVPVSAYNVARIVAIKVEDCGPCTQTVVNQALGEKVDPTIIAAAIGNRPEELPADEALAFRFAEAIVHKSHDLGALNAQIVQRWGKQGLIDLAFGISSAHIFPTVKRALGYGEACHLIELNGTQLQVMKAA